MGGLGCSDDGGTLGRRRARRPQAGRTLGKNCEARAGTLTYAVGAAAVAKACKRPASAARIPVQGAARKIKRPKIQRPRPPGAIGSVPIATARFPRRGTEALRDFDERLLPVSGFNQVTLKMTA